MLTSRLPAAVKDKLNSLPGTAATCDREFRIFEGLSGSIGLIDSQFFTIDLQPFQISQRGESDPLGNEKFAG